MRRYFQRRKRLFILVVTVMLLTQAAILLNSVLRQKLVDAALLLQSKEIARYVLLMIGYGLVRGGLYTAQSILESCFNARIGDDMRQAGFMGIIQRPARIFLSVNDADYVSAVTNDVRTIQSQYVQMSYMVLLYGASMVTSVVLLLYYQPAVAVAAVLCAALTTFLPIRLGKYTQKYRKAFSQQQSAFTACMTELFSGFSVIHSFGVLSHATNRFNAESDALRKAEYRAEGMEAFAEDRADTEHYGPEPDSGSILCHGLLGKDDGGSACSGGWPQLDGLQLPVHASETDPRDSRDEAGGGAAQRLCG